MEKVIFEKPFLKIVADDDKELIHLRWINFAQSDEFREGLNFALDYVRKNKIKRWLANLRDMSIIKEADRDWTNNEWFPEVAKTDLKRMAILVSLDFLNQSAVTRIMNKAEQVIRFETEYFNDIDRAREWLMKET
ncbi:MAG TPA: STAS/SEC14 domain-containing protein [Bacteroidia bacterium]|nr:STAS/SEC14 domain-containing protein [Bacteroidia bacterium]